MFELKPIPTDEGRRRLRTGPPEGLPMSAFFLTLAQDFAVRRIGGGDESFRLAYRKLRRGSLATALGVCLRHPVGVALTRWRYGDRHHVL